MNICFFSTDNTSEQTLQALREQLPDHNIQAWPYPGDPQTLDYAICWGAPVDFFHGADNLKAIFSLGAGVDHLIDNPGLPKDVPIIRLSDAGMADKIAEYVHFGVLRWHRHFDRYSSQQARKLWQPLTDINTSDYRVGIMGMGVIGSRIASRLQAAGYTVCGWKRTAAVRKTNFTIFHGGDQLSEFLGTLNTLVCVLPLTAQTTGLINKELIQRLPKGATLINVGRGGHVVEEDLLNALDDNYLAGVLLDVSDTEPPPENHRLWDHPQVFLTPHIAGPTQIQLSVDQIVSGIKRLDSGASPDMLNTGIVDNNRGY